VREDLAMGETILIAVKRHEQIEEIIPSLKNAVKAGTRLVFLVRSHVSSFQLCCLNYVETLQPGASAALAARYSSFGAQAQFVERRISAACEVLSSQGIVVTVHPYTGRLRKAIRKYTAREDVQLIVMAKGAVPKGMRLVDRILRLIPFFKMTPDSALRSYFVT
jgi:nucleotide-binding universal stress UspA family protein